ncbi:MAG: Fe-S cluster assembly protein SufD [Chloroflexi bacterium]|jgi:Fe-S cluster assembly protein SufD|nr:Fe-S cluster assembly protein SufD [Chloroflexota bacterium]
MSQFTRENVEKLSSGLDEPQWMLEFRLRAWEVYENTEMPKTSDEEWRRTDLRRLKLDQIGPSVNGDAATDVNIPAFLGGQLTEDEAGGNMLQIDGVVRQYELSQALKDQGVIFCDMHTAVRDYPQLVKEYFMTKGVPVTEGKFAALHGAFWRGGTFLYVPKNVQAVAPLHTVLWSASGKTFTHTLVVLEASAEAIFMDEYASADGQGQTLHNGVIELLVGDNAHLIYAGLQDFGRNMWQLNHERGRVGRDGKLDWVTSMMGTRLTKAFQTMELDEMGAWGRMSGIFFTNGRQHLDLDTQQNHNAAETVSDLLYKGALKDRSRTVWQGMIKALPDSQRINGFQANRNLMLDRSARADSIPGLEIMADDVICTHASAIGRLDEEELFYLMSRGIPRKIAIEMSVQGFFDPLMRRIPFEGVRNRIFDRIVEKIR